MLKDDRSLLLSRNAQRGINIVDLMMWLVVAALLLAAAIQGIGYYMQATYVYHARSDLAGAHQWVAATSALNSKLPIPADMEASLAAGELSLTTAGGTTNIGLLATKNQTYCVGVKSLNISDLSRNVFYSTSDDPNNVIRSTRIPDNCGSVVAFAPIGTDTSGAVAPANAPVVSGSVASPTTANFVWDAIPGASSYRVESKVDAGGWSVEAAGHPTTSITIIGAENQEISVRVTAINSAGESASSNIAKVVLPATTPSAYVAWGLNTNSQLNIGSAVDVYAPNDVLRSGGLTDKKVTYVRSGAAFSCALAEQKVYCWGSDGFGQLGNGAGGSSAVPTEITMTALAGKPIDALTVGDTHSCIIAGGAVYCWGHNGFGKTGMGTGSGTTHTPAAVNSTLIGMTVTSIEAGSNSTCAVSAGKAYCWGYNAYRQIGNGTTTNATAPVAVYADGHLSGKAITAVYPGGIHSCALAEGKVYCWGSQSRAGTAENSSFPVPVDTSGVLAGKTVTLLGVGSDHSCLVADNNTYCWGGNSKYQMGANTGPSIPNYPTAISNDLYGIFYLRQITALSVGADHSCVVASGKAYCWGYNATGQIGQGDIAATSNIKEVVSTGALAGKTVVSVYAGISGTFAGYTDNVLPVIARPAATAQEYSVAGAWGESTYGKLNIAAPASANPSPAEFLSSGSLTGKKVSKLETGNDHSCAISEGELHCWGYNGVGQLGTRGTLNMSEPTKVFSDGWLRGKVVTDVSLGSNFTCAIADGKAYCWGVNNFGQTGNSLSGFYFSAPVPVYAGGVLSGKTVTDIDAGGSNACAAADGKAYCWGYNTEGELGNGDDSGTRSHYPVEVVATGVLSGKTVTAVSTGSSHTCVIASDAPYCWGYNFFTQLGNGSRAESSSPVTVNVSGALSGKIATAVSVGTNHSCVIADLRSYCWGYNASGQLGTGSATVWNTMPTGTHSAGLMQGKDVTSLIVGQNHSCALAGGKIYCWGMNANGELGNGTTTGSATPVAVSETTALSGKSPSILWSGNANAFAGH